MSTINWEDFSNEAKNRKIKEMSPEEIFNKYGVPIEEIKIKKIIMDAIPSIKIGAVPTKYKDPLEIPPDKKIIINASKRISYDIAILEYLDNIFDNFERNIDDIDSLNIRFIFYQTELEDGIIIEENSGGIKIDKIRNLLIIGHGSESFPKKIGTWGEAFLNATFCIGTSLEIFSYHLNGLPFHIYLEDAFFQSGSEWEVNPEFYKNSEIKMDKGTTKFIIRNISTKFTSSSEREKTFSELYSKIKDTYWKRVEDCQSIGKDINITFLPFSSKEEKIIWNPIDFTKIFSYYPFCPPILLKDYQIHVKNEDNEEGFIFTDVYAGMNPFIRDKENPYHRYYGISMFGNDRLFADSIYDKNYVGYGLTETNIPSDKDKNSVIMLSIFIFFKALDTKWNSCIPWGQPTKHGFHIDNTIQDQLIKLIGIVSERFIKILDIAGTREGLFKIFTPYFVNLPNEEKIEFFKNKKNIDTFLFTSIEDIRNDEDLIKAEFSPFINIREEYLQKIEVYTDIIKLKENNQILNGNAYDYNEYIKVAKSKEDWKGLIPILFENFIIAGYLPDFENDDDSEGDINNQMDNTECISESPSMDAPEVISESPSIDAPEVISESPSMDAPEVNSYDKVDRDNKNKKKGSKAGPIIKDITKIGNISRMGKKNVRSKSDTVNINFKLSKVTISQLRDKFSIDKKVSPTSVIRKVIAFIINEKKEK